MRKFISAVMVLAALAGCAGTNFTYDQARQVRIGMTEAEVVQLMGRPYSVVSRPDGQMWIWSRANAFGSSKVVSFRLSEGKVVEVPDIPDSFR